MNQNQCRAGGGKWERDRCVFNRSKHINPIKPNNNPFRLIGSYIGIAFGILITLMLRFENIIWGFPNLLPCNNGDCWRAINYTNIIYLSIIGFIIGYLAHIVLTRHKDRRTIMVVSSVLGIIILGLLIFKGGEFLSFFTEFIVGGEMKREIVPKGCEIFLAGVGQTGILGSLRISNNINPQNIHLNPNSQYNVREVNNLLWVNDRNDVRCINKISNSRYGNTNGCSLAYSYCTPIHITNYRQNAGTNELIIALNSRTFISNSVGIGLIFNKIGSPSTPVTVPLGKYDITKGKNQIIVYLNGFKDRGRYIGYFIDLETYARLSDNTLVVTV